MYFVGINQQKRLDIQGRTVNKYRYGLRSYRGLVPVWVRDQIAEELRASATHKSKAFHIRTLVPCNHMGTLVSPLDDYTHVGVFIYSGHVPVQTIAVCLLQSVTYEVLTRHKTLAQSYLRIFYSRPPIGQS